MSSFAAELIETARAIAAPGKGELLLSHLFDTEVILFFQEFSLPTNPPEQLESASKPSVWKIPSQTVESTDSCCLQLPTWRITSPE
jgi:hypothetical protein